MKRLKRGSARAVPKKESATVSLIFYLLDRLWNFFSEKIVNGFFGTMLTAYSKEQKSFDEGFLKDHFTSGSKLRMITRRLKFYISGTLESSWFLRLCSRTVSRCVRIPLKTCGSSLFSFGIYTVLVYFIRLIVPGLLPSDIGFVLTGIGVCIVSVPMMLSKECIATAVGNSVIPRMIFSDAFGLREENYEVHSSDYRIGNNVLIWLGLLAGGLTLFVHPLWIIAIVTVVIVLSIILVSPEIGVLLSVFFLPFFSLFENASLIFAIIISIIGVSYLLKLLRGKRILRMELMDLSVVAFAFVLFLSGAISAGGTKGYYEALLYCVLILGYFLVVNLMRTTAWLKRLIYALVSSGTIVAVIGIGQYLFGVFHSGNWVDVRLFADIRGRVTSVFDNPNILGMYLCLIFPFALYAQIRSQKKNERFLCRICIGAILLCILFTWSRGAWLAALITGLLFALFTSKKTIRVLFFCLLAIPFMPMILPKTVLKRFLSIGNLTDSSLQYRLYTWKGSARILKENFWGGIGYGNTAFREVYPQYAYAGIEAAEHSHNLFLQVMIGMGIGGLLLLLTVIFFGYQMNLEYIKNTKDTQTKLMVITALCAFTAILVMGVFDFVWYNYRVFFLFWVVLAIACAGTRIGNAEQRRHSYVVGSDQQQATVDINL